MLLMLPSDNSNGTIDIGIIIITKKVAVLVENTWIKGNETNWCKFL